MRNVEVNGHSVAYRDVGEGPPLVLLHGFLCDSRCWRGQLEDLSDLFRVLAWDAPGAGSSSDPPDSFTTADWARCLAGFLGLVGIERAQVLGLSWGGILTQEFYRLYPGRVQTLILCDTYAGWKGSLLESAIEKRLERCFLESSLPTEVFVPRWVPEFFTEDASPDLEEEMSAVVSDFHPLAFRLMAKSSADTDTSGLLPNIGVPTLLLWGDADRRSPMNIAEQLRDAIPDAELAVIANAGHVSNMEQPEEFDETEAGDEISEPYAAADLHALPAASDRGLPAKNEGRGARISKDGEPARTIVRGGYRRKSDYEVSLTDPDASLMQHKRGASRMGYHVHYVVDGGKARVILNVLVTPADVTENQPMLDLLWRTIFRWRARVCQVTGDSTYGTKENIAAVEKASIHTYLSMADFEKKNTYYGASMFAYEPEQDLYVCPRGGTLAPVHSLLHREVKQVPADPESCNGCPSKPECTPGSSGRVLMRSFDEELLERVRSYRGTRPYEKALRKSKVWVEPMFGEAKQWHGMRRFRLRTLRRVNAEALLIATEQNIKLLLTFWGRGPRKLAQCQVLRRPAPTPSANSRLLQSSHRRRSTPLLARFSTGWGCSQKFEWLRRQEGGRDFARRLGLLFRGYSARARGALGTLEKPLLVLREGPLLGSHADQS